MTKYLSHHSELRQLQRTSAGSLFAFRDDFAARITQGANNGINVYAAVLAPNETSVAQRVVPYGTVLHVEHPGL